VSFELEDLGKFETILETVSEPESGGHLDPLDGNNQS
jgi:hypothetical protein